MRSSRLLLLLAASLTGACGDDDGGGGDGGDDGTVSDASTACVLPGDPNDCFPIDGSHPGGTIELGTGFDGWRPMGLEERISYGIQGGFHFDVHARISGLEPGDPDNSLDSCNPRTRFRAFFEDGTHISPGGQCPLLLGYTQENGDYVLAAGPLQLQFDTCLRSDDLFGREFRIVVEVIDKEGRYAMDEQMVTALPPFAWPDAGPLPPDAGGGEMDAGPSDAGEGRPCPYPPRP